eukprot:1155653-Prorocentrum_minimum.AAC.1
MSDLFTPGTVCVLQVRRQVRGARDLVSQLASELEKAKAEARLCAAVNLSEGSAKQRAATSGAEGDDDDESDPFGGTRDTQVGSVQSDVGSA